MAYQFTLVGPMIIATGILLALGTVAGMRRLFPAEVLRRAHETTGSLLSIVGTLYAVLLGLLVVDAMVRFERAMDEVQSESNSLADIFLLAERLPEPQQSRIRDLCRTYAEEVTTLEWPLMASGLMSVEARRTALALARSVNDLEPASESQKIVFPMLLDQIQDLWNLRRNRANAVQFGVPAVEWAALLLGAAVTACFVGLFNVEHSGLQYLMTGLAALVIGLNLYLVALFGYPFAGDLTVSKRPFEMDVRVFGGEFDSSPAHVGEAHARTNE